MKRHILRFEQASFLVVVMLTAFVMISCIPRNPNTLPVADFKLVESSATELRQLHFDASTSTDKEDSTDKLIARWDFNGDGVWEIDYSANNKANEVVSHSYNVVGTTTVIVEVKDSKGLTSRREKEIQINLAPPESLYLGSASGQEITIIWDDISTSEDSYNVSLNDNPLEQLPENTEEYTFELDTSATQTISVYCTKGTMKSNKTELVMGINLSESTTVFEEVSVTLPASHVGGEVRIEVSQQTPELPEGCNPLSSIYDIDIELSDDATFFPIKLAFDPSYEPSNGSDMMPLILHFDSDSGIWIPMMTSIGEDSNLVTYTSSFSEFVLAEVPANSAILNVKIVDFDTASRGFTFVNNPLSMVDADNKMTPYNYSAEEIQEVGGGFCYGMSVVSAATYINNLPRDPYFEFDNDDLLGYLIISRDGKPLLHFDRTLQAFNHLTSCGPIIRLVWGEFTKQYLAKLEVTWRIIFSAHRITQTLKPMSNSFEISEALAILSALRIPVAISLRPKELMLGEAHSVLAYGFKIVLGGIDFLIYDPNYPFEEKELSIRQSYIEGEYGEDYEWFFAQSVEIFAKSVLLGDALEDMIEEAYAPRFKGLYYTPEDGIIHLSLWNHNRPDNHNTPLLEVLKKENGGSYGTLRSYMNLDTTQTFVDEDVSHLNTYTYKLSRSDGKTSDEYSIFTRDMTIVPSDGSFISPDATLTINVTDSLGLDNIRAYTVVNYSQYPYVLIDGKRENGNIEVGADLLRNWFGGNNDSLQLMIVGDCEDGFIVREVTYFPSDNASPTVTKVSGPDGEVSGNSSTFTWTGSDSDGTITKYEYRKDEGSWVSNGTSTSYTWSSYSEGDHKFEVRAQDNEGAYSNIISWSFTYSTGTIVVGEVVLVEGGTFMMGDTWGDGRQNELPVHEVTLTYDFFVGKYEVTFEEYDAFCDATGKSKPSDGSWGRGTRPVINIYWKDAVAYCNWLSEKNNLPKAYDSNGNLLDASGNETTDITKVVGYRLLTEAEWEYAARGGKESMGYKYSGSNTASDVAWYSENSGGKTHEVGTKLPNELGIYDMSGNVWEWCSDWYSSNYYSTSPSINPYNHTSISRRVERCSGWREGIGGVKVSNRYGESPSTYRYSDLGFRVARTATASSLAESMPTARSWLVAVNIGDKIMAIGGGDRITKTPYAKNEIYNPITNSWETLTPMPTPRYALAAAEYNGKVYVFGGQQIFGNASPVNNVEIYDPVTDSWSTGSPMPNARCELAAATCGDKIYVISGLNYATRYNTLQIYSPGTDSWSVGAPLPKSFSQHAAVGYGGKVYVFGGMDNSRKRLDTVYIYDPQSDTWSSGTPAPTGRSELAAVVVGSKIYIFGGITKDFTEGLTTVDIYDPLSDSWQKGDPSLSKRSTLASASVGSKAYLIGGYLYGNPIIELNSVEAYSTE